MPEEDFVYLGDSANFPYGTRTAADLRGLVARNTEFLLERGAKLLVIACNSATSAGADTAREIAERDIAASGEGPVTLSAEFQALNQQVAKVGTATGIFLILTIYVMTAKPFL